MNHLIRLTALLAMGCFGSNEPDPGLPPADAGVTVPDGGVGNCGDSWVLTYRINGTFYITDTTAGMGNADEPLTEGLLKIRVPDVDGSPGAGEVYLTQFSHGERFTVTAFGIETATDVAVRAGPNPCGLAQGTRQDETVTWATCTLSDTHGVDKNSWTPDDSAEGPGCLNDYTTNGNVACTGLLCSTGGLEEGDNPQSERYNQPLSPLVFSEDWNTFSMERAEIPNRSPSRTWFDLQGILVDQTRSNIPMCLCEG